jgi:cell wall-associated NlpC family hydrolase
VKHDEIETRKAICAEALSWVRTPFHDDARVKGVGVDCAQFVAGVYLAVGAVPEFETPRYVSQWFMHKTGEMLRDFVLQFGKQIDESDVKHGDLVLYKLGRAFAHAAIVIDWPNEIVHAHKLSNMVVRALPFSTDLKDKETQFFSLWAK